MTPPGRTTRRAVAGRELIALLSMTIALGALGVDLMLPAFTEMRADFGLAPDSNQIAGVVTTYVLGLAAGMLVFGPLSDRFGRKKGLFAGFAIYGIGAVASALAPSLEALLISRAVWGIGAAAPRAISLSVIRDLYEGERMARTMSFVFAVFILVPIIAPTIGAGIISVATWPWVFWFAAVFVAVIALWTLRLPETLHPEHRLSLSPSDLRAAFRTVVSNRQTAGHTLALTASFAAFVSWLATSQLIVEDVLGRPSLFPFIFGGLAAAMGLTMLANAALVERFGVVRVLRTTVTIYMLAAGAFAALSIATGGTPGMWPLLIVIGVLVSMHALLIPNTNSRAMDPMGAIAGTAAAVIGAFSTGAGAALGAAIDSFYDGSVTPLAVGFLVSSVLAATFVRWAETEPAEVASRR